MAQARKLGDAFHPDSEQGPQISQVQLDVRPNFHMHDHLANAKLQRVLGYIESGKKAGATIHIGGERHGTEGFFVQPTIFTGVTPDMAIAREEIFGPVAALVKFKSDEGNSIDPGNFTFDELRLQR